MAAIDYGAIVFKNGERYKGDQLYPKIDELGIRFYKCDIIHDEDHYSFSDPFKKVFEFEINGAKFKVKKIAQLVMNVEILYQGDSYHAIFGYGIDNKKEFWDHVKYIYHSKADARKIDNVLNRLDF